MILAWLCRFKLTKLYVKKIMLMHQHFCLFE